MVKIFFTFSRFLDVGRIGACLTLVTLFFACGVHPTLGYGVESSDDVKLFKSDVGISDSYERDWAGAEWEAIIASDDNDTAVDASLLADIQSGWKEENGNRYYVAEDGSLASEWFEIQEKIYYFNPENGNAMTTGFVTLQEKNFFFGDEGVLRVNGWFLADDSWFYADQAGELILGWFKQNGVWYYLDPDRGGAMLSGVFMVDGSLYCAYSSGALAVGDGWISADSTWYYTSASGALHTGWLNKGGAWYWLDRQSGAMGTGWYLDGPTWYYSDSSGAMLSSRWLNQGGTWYYLNSSGALHTGWLNKGGAWYWLDFNTGAMAVGKQLIGGKQYFFSSNGVMMSNLWVSLDGGRCGFLGSSGDVVVFGKYDSRGKIICLEGESGWRVVDGVRFYFDPSDGGALCTGWFMISGVFYYADSSGIVQSDWIVSGGSWYYLDPNNGAMKTGWILLDGAWYYLDPASGSMRTGWLQDGGDWYFLRSNGSMVASSSVRISDGTYWYMNSSGRHDLQAGIDIIVRTARSLLGVPYVWLGVYPQDGGMDCASFTWYLYKQLGIDIGFETYDQMNSGVRIFGSANPGDLILMYYGSWPNYNPLLPEHVVLYAGDGMVYEEPTFGGYCQYVSLASKGASVSVTRRILS